MDRNPKDSLSPHEVNALRALQHHSQRAISSEDLRLLLEMGLAVKDGERIGLSPAGRARLEREDHARLRSHSPAAEA
jgi:hypothetical protein